MNDNTVTQMDKNTSGLSENAGKRLGWIGIVVGVIGFFWLRIWLGAAAAILGVVGLFSPQKKLNTIAVVIGAVAILLGIAL